MHTGLSNASEAWMTIPQTTQASRASPRFSTRRKSGTQKRVWLCGDVGDVCRGGTLCLLYRHMRGLPSSSQHALTSPKTRFFDEEPSLFVVDEEPVTFCGLCMRSQGFAACIRARISTCVFTCMCSHVRVYVCARAFVHPHPHTHASAHLLLCPHMRQTHTALHVYIRGRYR